MTSPESSREDRARSRRTRNYWEPIFDATAQAPIRSQWDFENNRGPTRCSFLAVDLADAIKNGARPIINGVTFHDCDFLGTFDIAPREIVFKNCTFVNCDFGQTTWNRAKFSGCKFSRCSLSQSNWGSCEFRACIWSDIGMSGNAMDMTNTIITNPGSFVRSAYTNLDDSVLKNFGTKASYQAMRLEGTKATVARQLVRMLVNIGDESAYYDALRTASNQSAIAKIIEAKYTISTEKLVNKTSAVLSLIVNIIEYAILNVAGFINAWGRSVARPFVIGVALITIYSVLYLAVGFASDINSAFVMATEITLLTGYTNHSGDAQAWERYLMLGNMLAGLVWYVVFIPTLVNRISRVR